MVYLLSAAIVLVGSGVLAMAGLGAAFIFVPLFYFLGVPLAEAAPAALLLNVVSMLFATVSYWRGHLVDWRLGVPVLITAVLFAPLGALVTPMVNKSALLILFALFLLFAGAMMLFYRTRQRPQTSGPRSTAARAAVGTVAGFVGGLLGVGGGNIVLPVFNWLGVPAKVAAGTTALVVVCSSLAGFLGHITLGQLDPVFVLVTAPAAAVGSLVGSRLMQTRLSNQQLKYMIGVLLWLIAVKMLADGVRL